MGINSANKEKYTIVKVEEEKLDSLVAPELKAQVVLLTKSDVSNLIVDLSNVKYCDSSGLSALLVANRGVRGLDGSLVLCGLQPMVEKLVAISQLDKIFNIVPTLSEAEDVIAMEIIEKEL